MTKGESEDGATIPDAGFREEDMKADLADYFADLATWRMPFGRYRGRPVHALPLEYLQWFAERGGGFPSGRLGELMAFVCQVKTDGAEVVFAPLRRSGGDFPGGETPRRD